jgi:hypothetical protein
VRDVRAGDEKQQRDGAAQQKQRRAEAEERARSHEL